MITSEKEFLFFSYKLFYHYSQNLVLVSSDILLVYMIKIIYSICKDREKLYIYVHRERKRERVWTSQIPICYYYILNQIQWVSCCFFFFLFKWVGVLLYLLQLIYSPRIEYYVEDKGGSFKGLFKRRDFALRKLSNACPKGQE